MDIFTKGALWDYWKMGGDEIEVSGDESSDLEKHWSDKEEETPKIFKIKTDVFEYETPLCLAFNEFNYLPKVDPDLLTKDIMGFKTYEDYKDDWIYEWNKNVPWLVIEGLINDDESSIDCWKIWKSHEIYYHDYDEGEYENGSHEEGHELCGIKTREVPEKKLLGHLGIAKVSEIDVIPCHVGLLEGIERVE
ncbi:hypothetical protein Tco_0888074, partial [Tanacetum coccineum]